MNSSHPTTTVFVRPTDRVGPTSVTARRAWVALVAGRIEDAEGHVRRMQDPLSQPEPAGEEPAVERAWKSILEGVVAEAWGRLPQAAECFRTVIKDYETTPSDFALTPAHEVGRYSRVQALALECLGRVLRRQDDPDAAADAHRKSLKIREAVGSWEECRQSAHDLALDAFVARKYSDAIAWHQRALEFAQLLGEAGLPLRAETLTHLARVLRETGDVKQSIKWAQESFDLRQHFDPASLDALRAGLELAEGRLSFVGESAKPTESAIDEVFTTLTELRAEFLAWNAGAEHELARCEEALDFARRLRESSLLQ